MVRDMVKVGRVLGSVRLGLQAVGLSKVTVSV